MAKRKTKKVSKKRKKIAGYATRLTPKDLIYDKNFVSALKTNTTFGAASEIKPLPKPDDPGWVSYKVGYTTTPRPNTHTFTQQDVFNSLLAFGNDVIDLIDASISNDRRRKAFKKFVSASYERQMEHTKGLARTGLRLFTYDLTPALKNTEE